MPGHPSATHPEEVRVVCMERYGHSGQLGSITYNDSHQVGGVMPIDELAAVLCPNLVMPPP